VTSKLKKYEPAAATFAIRRSDARDDAFVREYMAPGETLRVATKYSQSTASAALQLAVAGTIVGLALAMATGSTLGAVAAGLSSLVVVALALALETSGRLVITDRALIVQSSVLLTRYERAYIEDARVDRLGPRHWLRVDLKVFDPRDCFRESEGLRFRYTPPKGRSSEVFIAIADADEHLRLLQGGPQALSAAESTET